MTQAIPEIALQECQVPEDRWEIQVPRAREEKQGLKVPQEIPVTGNTGTQGIPIALPVGNLTSGIVFVTVDAVFIPTNATKWILLTPPGQPFLYRLVNNVVTITPASNIFGRFFV